MTNRKKIQIWMEDILKQAEGKEIDETALIKETCRKFYAPKRLVKEILEILR